jgi:ABC-type spermidine/putrescine transport system permease subunit I
MPDCYTPSRRHETWLTLPSLLWMAVFFAVSALNLFLISFRPAEVSGDVGQGWTTVAWRVFAEPGYQEVLLRTLGISLATTAGCVILALPTAWFILQAAPSSRPWLLLSLVLPFWTSFLVRVFSWRALLQSSGPVATLLTKLGLLEDGSMLLYNPYVVVVVMIYTCLPLAVLPLHAAMEKFDFGTYEAARDLGAGPLQAFWRVVVPSVRGGIVAACLLVGVPSLGSYVVPEMVGGIDAEMLGSKIGQRLFSDRNLPEAAALASGLALVAMPLVWLSLRRRKEGLS